MNHWKERHLRAVKYPMFEKEKPFIDMLRGWVSYAEMQQHRYGSDIGNDYMFGDAWINIGLALKTMLDGDLGTRLDCGTLSAIINDNLEEQGYDVDAGERKVKAA